MNTYARIVDGGVAELFETDGDISAMFNSEMVWIDVTTIDPLPQVGWSYDGSVFTASEPTPQMTLADVQAELSVSIDAAADNAYTAIGGPSPGRLAEYQQANADAIAFQSSGYAGDVPATIACWSQATGWSAQQACEDILATAAAWRGALEEIRSARLIGKHNVMEAPTIADAQAAANAAVANIQAVPAGL